MKNLICRLALVLVFVASAASQSLAGGIGTAVFKAKISGTVRSQVILGVTDGRIGTTALNNKRVFTEFAVSPDDYELVFSISSDVLLVLVPKSASAGLPNITVFTLTNGGMVIDTHSNTFAIGGSLSSTATGTLFENLAGEGQGAIKFKGTFLAPQLTKVSLDARARGTGGSGVALLSFKISTGGLFVQGP
jgi:hypothetical protein